VDENLLVQRLERLAEVFEGVVVKAQDTSAQLQVQVDNLDGTVTLLCRVVRDGNGQIPLMQSVPQLDLRVRTLELAHSDQRNFKRTCMGILMASMLSLIGAAVMVYYSKG